jgi:Flp pilus assembly protein TadB
VRTGRKDEEVSLKRWRDVLLFAFFVAASPSLLLVYVSGISLLVRLIVFAAIFVAAGLLGSALCLLQRRERNRGGRETDRQ